MEGSLKRLEKIEEMPVGSRKDSIKDILASSDLFEGLSDSELEKVLPLCREEVYEVGTTIFSEGCACHTMYVVESGKVSLEINLHISRAREDTATIDVITASGCLCCSGLINPCILNSTGRALETTKVIGMDATELKALFEENPEMGRKTMYNLATIIASRFQNTRDTLGHILSVIFHDLKAPLAAIESYHRVMLGGFAGELSNEQRNMLERSSKRISELLDLLSNIMDVSRIEARDLAMSKISLAQVVLDSIEVMRPLAEEKGLEVKAEVPDELPPIYGSKERLKQVVINLLSNAIKFTPSGGTVTAKVIDGTDHLQVQVADTGVGIPAGELPKIFGDFYRGLDVAERGAGLGLSIAKRIVEAHRGKIWAVSPCPGSDRGSEFTFALPKDSDGPAEK
jgi:signal transduction histidine kinase